MNNTKEKKFDLSLRRIIARISLTFVLGVIFGIAMFPFLQRAEGLLDTQQAAIGWQNFVKMVALWGIFTALVTALSFSKKRFRMTAVLLIFCWFVSILVLVWIRNRDINDKVATCDRAKAYDIDPAFDRALNLIKQREQITDETATYIGFAFQNRNCLDIRFAGNENLPDDAEGVFIGEDPTIQDLKVYIREDYKSFDDLTLALILVHELTHVGQQIVLINNPDTVQDCYLDEAQAFYEQNFFILMLNEEEQRSIITRIKDNLNKNPIFEITYELSTLHNEVTASCNELIRADMLNEEQYNQCFEQGIMNKITSLLKESPYYKDQCNN